MEDNSRQARAERTRQSLVIAARHAFSEKGYQATTVSSITAAADVAHGTFYLYFSNKEELFVELVEAAWTELYDEAFAGEASSPGTYDPRRPRIGVRGAIEVYVRHGRLWRALLEGVLTSKGIERAWFQHRHKVQDELARRFRLLQDHGMLRPIDPVMCAEGLIAMMEWFALTRLSFTETAPLTDDEDVVETLIDLWTHALGIEEPAGVDGGAS